MVENKEYKVGIYLRLSREDELKGESGSISNQRDIIWEYIRKNNLIYVDEYVDDGISGATFDREGWDRLIEDINSKKIDMVITKDLSRFGRNEGQQLRYLDFFYENNIRYVAILDNVDTADEYNTSNEMIPIQCFFNEKHIRDTSKKMKASVNNKRKQGCFLGTYTPYGYNKDPNNKYKLIIDETSAEVVRKIFHLFVEGHTIGDISKILTDEKIPIPSEYKNINRGVKSTAYGIWDGTTISRMLRLPTYVGDLTQGRIKKPSYKSKKRVKTKKEDWIICKDKCPAIIDRDTFDLVQNLFEKNKNHPLKENDLLLKGFIYCKECNHSIGFRTYKEETKSKGLVTRCYGTCNYWNKFMKYGLCTPHRIKYFELEDLILKEIKKECKKYLKSADLTNILKSKDKTDKLLKEYQISINKLEKEIELSTNKIDSLYNDKLEGIIDLEMYQRLYNNITEETNTKKQEISTLKTKIFNIKNNITNNNEKYKEVIKDFLTMKKPNRQLLSCIVDKITIDEDKNIDIYYKFKSLNDFL